MTSFGTNLRRRVWQPFLILAALSLATGLLFTFVLPATRLLVGGFALLLFLVALAAGAMLSRNLLSSLKNLARAAEQIAPDALERAGKHPDEIAALAQTITTITSEIREKEQTWMGDIERRNQAVQKLTQILQEQAASFETALNSVDVPVCLFESDGDLVQVNQRFCQFLGTTAENLKRMGLLSIVAELQKLAANPQELKAAAEEIYRKPSAPSDNAFALKQGRGTVRLYCVPVFGELNSLIGIIISTAELADSSAVEHLKSEFISTVSHELRTPLTAIKGAIGLVLGGAGGPVSGMIRELLEIAASNTERLIELVSDILEIFRMEAGKLELKPVPVTAEALVRQACARVAKEAQAAGIQLETRVVPDMPPALVDEEKIEMVLEKLLSNAIKFSPQGSPVRIGAEPMVAHPYFLQFWVQDFGSGIPPEAQERIFEKFEQAESVMTRQHQGPGLGLAICRGVVEGHGGRIWVISEMGNGSVFYFSLPAAHAALSQEKSAEDLPSRATAGPSQQAGGAEQTAAELSSATPLPSSQHLVMVVDDDADTRNVMARMLQSQGHFVVEVGSGRQVAELARRHHPEVITLDLIMPDMDGIEVLRVLKADAQIRDIPVICMSVSDDLSARSLELGAAQFLRKPLEFHLLLRAIQTACAAAGTGAG